MDLAECFRKNDMILPDYTEDTIIDVMRIIYQYCGYSEQYWEDNSNLQKYVKNKNHILLILSDGMGSNLVDSLPNNMLLNKNKVADLLTVCPTTTGCVLPSIATAEYPAVHGMLGWYNYNRDRDINYYTLLFQERTSRKNLKELEIEQKDIYVCDSVMNKLNRKTIALFPQNIVNSDFSKFMVNNRIAYTNIENAFEIAINNIQENSSSETFTYLYLPYVDNLSHHNGVYSKEVYEVISKIENEIYKLKEKGIKDLEIIIIADHGQIDVTENDIVMNFAKYNNYFYALPGIDFGTATYYVKKDKRDEFLQEFKKEYKDKMYIFDTEQFIKNNVFGKGKVSKYTKSNLGEFISFCKKGAYFVNTIDEQNKYIGKIKGSHSGFSKEEMVVPLIIINT